MACEQAKDSGAAAKRISCPLIASPSMLLAFVRFFPMLVEKNPEN
jgi:hypothetical protein